MKRKPGKTIPSKTRLRRLLVPVDFSDSSRRALHYAADLVADSGGSLIVIHVIPTDFGWLNLGREHFRDLDKSLQEQAMHELRTLAGTSVLRSVSMDLEVRIGRPAEEIVAAASEAKCDLIVLSTRGLTGLDRYLLGSVADRVARIAPCPVLLMRAGKEPAGPKKGRLPVLRQRRKR